MKLSLQINEIYALELDSSSAVHVLYQLVLLEGEEGLLQWMVVMPVKRRKP